MTTQSQHMPSNSLYLMFSGILMLSVGVPVYIILANGFGFGAKLNMVLSLVVAIAVYMAHAIVFAPNTTGQPYPFSRYNALQKAMFALLVILATLSLGALWMSPAYFAFDSLLSVYIFAPFWVSLAGIGVWFGMLVLHSRFYMPAHP